MVSKNHGFSAESTDRIGLYFFEKSQRIQSNVEINILMVLHWPEDKGNYLTV